METESPHRKQAQASLGNHKIALKKPAANVVRKSKMWYKPHNDFNIFHQGENKIL